jgi:hypothetical protein
MLAVNFHHEGRRYAVRTEDQSRSVGDLAGNRRQRTEQRRKLATNEVANVARRYWTPEVFGAFYADYHITAGRVATLNVTNLDEIAAELRLKV